MHQHWHSSQHPDRVWHRQHDQPARETRLTHLCAGVATSAFEGVCSGVASATWAAVLGASSTRRKKQWPCWHHGLLGRWQQQTRQSSVLNTRGCAYPQRHPRPVSCRPNGVKFAGARTPPAKATVSFARETVSRRIGGSSSSGAGHNKLRGQAPVQRRATRR